MFLPLFFDAPIADWIVNIHANVEFVPKVIVKNGKKYVRVTNVLFDFNTTR